MTAFLTWSVIRAFPQTDGESIEVAGLQSEVTVHRDSHGIPTLTAETTDDLFRAQGFVHAQDRFWEMDFRRHMTSGRLSELFGEAQVGPTHSCAPWDGTVSRKRRSTALPPDALSYYEAYADGVNAYLDERQGGALALEYTVLGLQNSDYEPEPWTPTDSVAWLKAMAWDLRTNIEDETNRAILGQGLAPERLDRPVPGLPLRRAPGHHGGGPGRIRRRATRTSPHPPPPTPPTTPMRRGRRGPPTRTQLSRTRADTTPDAAEPAGQQDALGLTELRLLRACATLLERVDTLVGGEEEGIGSNSWVVSGEHTGHRRATAGERSPPGRRPCRQCGRRCSCGAQK